MIDMQVLCKQRVLRRDHVAVIVMGKARVQAVAGLRGFPVADAIREDDEILRGIEQSAGLEQHIGELRAQELVTVSASAMQYDNGVCRAPLRIQLRRTQRDVVQMKLG